MNFNTRLQHIVKQNNSLLCVGLDSDYDKLPISVKTGADAIFNFNKEIIEATSDLVCAYKPNSAFYESQGAEGVVQLKKTIEYVKKNYPYIPVILDAKRGDIGSTNEGYAKYAFDYLQADAITVLPYLGIGSLKPFLDRVDKGIIIMTRNSNPEAGEFQDLLFEGKPLYQIVANNIIEKWNSNKNCCVVVGATYPEELAQVRSIVGDMPILIPGVGAQGGDVEKTVKAGIDSTGMNAIINSSRGIIFASHGPDFAEKAREEASKLRDQINSYRLC